jgi:hypothetical protein
VECAGTAHLARGATFAAEEAQLFASSEHDGLQVRMPIHLEQGKASFRLVGLQPGKYRAFLFGGEDVLHTSFELPAQGDGALELYFGAR